MVDKAEASGGEEYKRVRKETLLVDPRELIVDFALRGRLSASSEEERKTLATQMIRDGQINPCTVRKEPNTNKFKLVTGFGRYEAVMYAREHMGHDEMKIRVDCQNINDKDAARQNIAENKQRRDTTPIEDAINCRRMMETYGESKEDCAITIGCEVNWISHLLSLLSLPQKYQDMVHKGTMPLSAAWPLLNLPEAEQDKIVSESLVIKKGVEKVSGSKVRANKRDLTPDKGGASQNRTLKEIKEFYGKLTVDGEDPSTVEFCRKSVKFATGEITEKQMENAIDKLLHAKPAK